MSDPHRETPLFSIVSPSLNCAGYLLRHLESIRRQNLPSAALEHWIIDGGSTDGTVSLLERQKDILWLSEPDRGISDAVNKGITRARGEWILWLNVDDQLAPGALPAFLDYLERNRDAKLVCGDEDYLGYDGAFEGTVAGWPYTIDELLGGRTSINQASTFVHREVYDAVGLMDVNEKYAMDYEWMVRATRRYPCLYLPKVLSIYQRRRGSTMDSNIAGQHRTFLAIRRRYGRSRLAPEDLRLRFYLWTDPLRRIRPLRAAFRWLKNRREGA